MLPARSGIFSSSFSLATHSQQGNFSSAVRVVEAALLPEVVAFLKKVRGIVRGQKLDFAEGETVPPSTLHVPGLRYSMRSSHVVQVRQSLRYVAIGIFNELSDWSTFSDTKLRSAPPPRIFQRAKLSGGIRTP